MEELGFVHQYVPAKSPDARVFLLLHGTGGDESDLLPIGRELDPEAALLSPRGNVLENGMPRFFRRLAEGVFDEEDVVRRANELADFVASAANHYGFDATRVTAVGYSNGANVAAAVILLRPETLSGAILLRAMVPLSQPPEAGDLKGRPVLISAGASDSIIPPENGERLAKLLEDRGAIVTFRRQPIGHSLIREDIVDAKEWLAQ